MQGLLLGVFMIAHSMAVFSGHEQGRHSDEANRSSEMDKVIEQWVRKLEACSRVEISCTMVREDLIFGDKVRGDCEILFRRSQVGEWLVSYTFVCKEDSAKSESWAWSEDRVLCTKKNENWSASRRDIAKTQLSQLSDPLWGFHGLFLGIVEDRLSQRDVSMNNSQKSGVIMLKIAPRSSTKGNVDSATVLIDKKTGLPADILICLSPGRQIKYLGIKIEVRK